MGIFDSVFEKKENTTTKQEKLPWIPLESMDQLETVAEKSNNRPQVIFKHSNTCGISRMVLNMFEGSYNQELDIDLYFLTIQNHREISNRIAEKFGVRHESPQLLVVKNGDVTFHTSHGAISDMDFTKYL